ncbi:Polysaccharide export protein [Candidatus Magnetoovum chiemensis]|nr:Polysaccharide export protein [Candidatus Magnetoovum chiemensis]
MIIRNLILYNKSLNIYKHIIKGAEGTLYRLFLYAALSLLLIGCSSLKHKNDSPPSNIKPNQPLSKANLKYNTYDFILGVSDTLKITVFRHDELSFTSMQIRPDGTLSLPLIGSVKAAGLTVKDFENDLEKQFSVYINTPDVFVNIEAIKSRKIYALGEVNKQGMINYDDNITLIQAIAHAEGFTADAKKSRIAVIRNGTYQLFDYNSLIRGKNTAYLQNGDIIYIPPKGIAVTGQFFKYISQILNPVVTMESGIVLVPSVDNALKGETSQGQQITITNSQ